LAELTGCRPPVVAVAALEAMVGASVVIGLDVLCGLGAKITLKPI
jgi:hypothetical protein